MAGHGGAHSFVILRAGGGSTSLPAKELVDGPPARTMTSELGFSPEAHP